MKTKQAKIKLVFGVLVFLSFLGAFFSGGKTANFLASVITGDYRFGERITSVKLSELGNGSDSLLVPYKNCSFATEKKPIREKLIFKEIAWMGDERSHTNEWIVLEKTVPGKLNISGWQILNENERISIIISQQTVLTDEKPEFILARNQNIAGVEEDALFTGAIRNTNEGLRLFNNDCKLIDEVIAAPNWPGGDNATKAVMVRTPNLGWTTAGLSSGDRSGEVAGAVEVGGCVDLNTSSFSDLVRLIGVGEKTAESIVIHRAEDPFGSIYDLKKVSGIGPVTVERIKEQGIVCDNYAEKQAVEPSILPEDDQAEHNDAVNEEPPEQAEQDDLSGTVCVNINFAPKEELVKIIHIGDSRAEEIINIRTEEPFASLDDLVKVGGISEARVADIKEQNLACVE